MTTARIDSSGTYSRRSLRDLASAAAPLGRGVRSRRARAPSRRLPPLDGRGGCRTRPAARLRSRVPVDVPFEIRDFILGERGRSPERAVGSSPSGVPMTSPLAGCLTGAAEVWAMGWGGGGLLGGDGRRAGAGASVAGPSVGVSIACLRVGASIARPELSGSIAGLEARALVAGLGGGPSSSDSSVTAAPWRRSAPGRRRRCGDGAPVDAASAASVSASSSGERWGALNPRRSPCDPINR